MEAEVHGPSSWEDLVAGDAVVRLQDLVERTRTCLFSTSGPNEIADARPMHVLEVDLSGSLWFFSEGSSRKNMAIGKGRRVQLHFANPGRGEYMVIQGDARIHRDSVRMRLHWTPELSVWFAGGSDDPELSLIEVVPSRIQYWMPLHGKLFSLLKKVQATITSKPASLTKQGMLRL